MRLLTAAVMTALAACANPSSSMAGEYPQTHVRDGYHPSTERQTPCDKPPVRPKWTGFHDRPVETCLGPNLFMIPMHYFYHQAGPDFQGSVGISLRWPSLEPLPPGARHADDYFDKNMDYMVHVMVDYLDKVDIETLLTNIANGRANSSDPDDPSDSIQQRVMGEPTFGLTPYYVDLEKHHAYLVRSNRELGMHQKDWKRDELLRISPDWYIRQDETGKVNTMIVCDNHLIPGDTLVDGVIVRAEATQFMNQCHHDFVIEEYKLSFSARYASSLLKDWQRIEAAIRDLFQRTHVKPEADR